MPPLGQVFSLGMQAVNARMMGRPHLIHASFYLTHRCNLRCLYCSSPYMKTSELTTAQWQKVIRDLRRLGCRRISILGGEPLLRKDFARIIHSVKEQGMRCVLTSNGLLVPRYLNDLKMLDTLVLSLDAVGAGNDRVRGAGVSEAVQRAIESAQDTGIPVKINAVMTSESAPHLDELIQFATTMAVSVTINVVRTGNDDLWHAAATVRQDDAGIRRLLKKLAQLARDNPLVLFSEQTYRFSASWPDYTCDRLETKNMNIGALDAGPVCHAGRAYLSINPDGTTHPCPITAGSIVGGNVVSDGIETAWASLVNHGCKYCYAPCMVEQNYLHSLNLKVASQFVRKHLPHYS